MMAPNNQISFMILLITLKRENRGWLRITWDNIIESLEQKQEFSSKYIPLLLIGDIGW